MTNGSGQIGTLGFPSFVGGLQRVVPGADNSLKWLRAVSVGLSSATDSITATTVLNWTLLADIHPRPAGQRIDAR